MLKRVSKVYFWVELSKPNIFASTIVNFLSKDYSSELSIKLMLKRIKGIHFFLIQLLCKQFNISCTIPISFFKEAQLIDLKAAVLNGSFLSVGRNFHNKSSFRYRIGLIWEKMEKESLWEMKQIGFSRFNRLRAGLPVRGQRTKTNSQTCRRSLARGQCF